MAHVAMVGIDLSVQVLAAVLPDPETMDSFLRILQERLKLAAVGAGAAQADVLRPVLRLFDAGRNYGPQATDQAV